MIKRDNSPALTKVVIIGVLIFLESLIGGIIVILKEGGMPDQIQWLIIILVAVLALVTHFLTFLRGSK